MPLHLYANETLSMVQWGIHNGLVRSVTFVSSICTKEPLGGSLVGGHSCHISCGLFVVQGAFDNVDYLQTDFRAKPALMTTSKTQVARISIQAAGMRLHYGECFLFSIPKRFHF